MGMVFPMCGMRGRAGHPASHREGLPISNAVAYMLAAPIVNPIVALSTYAAFRGQGAVGDDRIPSGPRSLPSRSLRPWPFTTCR